MTHYFLKANLSGVEIEFNTKDKFIVQSQLDEYFEIITGKSVAPKLFEAKTIEPKAKFESFENFKFESNVPHKETEFEQNTEEDKKTVFNFDNIESSDMEEKTEKNGADSSKEVEFSEIFTAKTSENTEDENNLAFDNIEIQKECAENTQANNGSSLDLYQPKLAPELPEFMQNKRSDGIFDDFIITAYYIKNVLAEKKFTIKFLNSKLYGAKEKLVDYAILDDAINKGFIKTLEVQEGSSFKEYSITESGEVYYLGLENQ